MNKTIWIIFIGLLGAIFFIVISVNKNKQVPYEKPKYRNIERKEYILGRFFPLEEIKIKSEIAGIIEDIYVKIGDNIKEGTPIAKLRIIPNPDALENAKKNKELSKVKLTQIEKNYTRNKILFEKGIIAKVEFEKDILALKNAQIEYGYSCKNYNIALRGYSRKEEARNMIKSTIDGNVIDIPVKKGMNITERNNFNEGNTIAVVADIENFTFEFTIGEMLINKIKISDEFNITIKAIDRIVRAKVIELKPSFSKDREHKASYLVKSKILINDNLPIKQGFSGLAEFTLETKKNVLTVREKNIIYEGRKTFVEIVQGKNKVSKIEIIRGSSNGIYTEIKKGIGKKDKVKIQ